MNQTVPVAPASEFRSRPGTRDAAELVGWLAVSFAAAAVGGWFTSRGLGDWYGSLVKPGWTPPDVVFGPVWTALYTMMAIAAWRVGRTRRPGIGFALGLHLVQLTLNVAWTAVFFTMRSPAGGAMVIVVLWLAIAATAWVFRRFSSTAAALMVPYLVWVTYAAALNVAIWQRNG